MRRLTVKTLLVTVDTPRIPKKVHNRRNGFTIPMKPSWTLAVDLLRHPGWSIGVLGRYWMTRGLPSYANYPGGSAIAVTQSLSDPRLAMQGNFEPAVIAEIRDRWAGNLVVKGIQHPEDAELAVALGAEGVVVSSHGGRNIDSLALPLHVLPEVRSAVGSKAVILADSGVRRGSDIAKLIGAGADAVMSGRAFLWGLSAGGIEGARNAASIMIDELDKFMASAGMRDLDDLREARWTDDRA